jgi:hypothetical protein
MMKHVVLLGDGLDAPAYHHGCYSDGTPISGSRSIAAQPENGRRMGCLILEDAPELPDDNTYAKFQSCFQLMIVTTRGFFSPVYETVRAPHSTLFKKASRQVVLKRPA